ncbi:hypothetical protein EVAR_25048_1 [Eumeta japonica]|uniref:Uncharacterized protein n=1 Tax=Eumeta variegata TaxID=151549 RepID=A0A4C1V9S8_EUMVA|nr:hypothetical protein EVAR_25048_1 [Eumeta japonica]
MENIVSDDLRARRRVEGSAQGRARSRERNPAAACEHPFNRTEIMSFRDETPDKENSLTYQGKKSRKNRYEIYSKEQEASSSIGGGAYNA